MSFALWYSELLRFCVPTCTTLPDIGHLHNLLALFDRVRQGLFEVDVLAGLQGRNRHLVMQMLGRRNHHGVDRGVGQELVVVLCRLRSVAAHRLHAIFAARTCPS